MRQGSLTIGVDIGTTGCRACVVADAAQQVAEASVSYGPDRPSPGMAEQDPLVWWKAFRETVSEVAGRVKGGGIQAIAISSQSTALVPVDRSFAPLRPAIIWQDTRSSEECREIAEHFGAAAIREQTGWAPSTFLVWPKVLWFMENEPGLMSKARWLLQVNGFILHRLCGEAVLDVSNAIGLPKDVRTLDWIGELCQYKDFPVEKFARVVPSTTVVGRVSRAAARHCGLPAELPVVAGGMDTACAALAVGAIAPGTAFEMSGTSGGIGVISEQPCSEQILGVAPHLFDGLFINHAPMSAAGASLTWFKEEMCFPEQQQAEEKSVSPYEVMEREVMALGEEPTGLLFLPYLAGERAPVWDPKARGAMLGLTLATSRAQMIKMVMEGVSYALRQNIEVAEAAGLAVEELRSCGGGSRSILWCQIKADIMGKPVVVFPAERDSAFGAAVLAQVGAADWDLMKVAEKLDEEEPAIYIPREDISEKYARCQKAYEQIYPHLAHLLPSKFEDPTADLDI